MPRPHPPEFRRRAVELARLHEKPIAQIVEDLGISDSCLRNWMRQADIDDGRRDGTSGRDRAEPNLQDADESLTVPRCALARMTP
jgi:transposase